MIKFVINNALVHRVSPIIQPTENFQKREIILDESWIARDGNRIERYVVIDFSGERMQQLENIVPGQRVDVECMLTGSMRNDKVYNSLRGLSITTPFQSAYNTAPQGYYPSQQGGYPQQPPMPGGYAQPASFPQPQYHQAQNGQQPQSGQSLPPNANNLPFRH